MTANAYQVAGESHAFALGAPYNGSDLRIYAEQIACDGADVVGLAGAIPRTNAYWDEVVALSKIRTTLLVWSGNEHYIRLLFSSTPTFDFVLSSQPDLPLADDATIVPEAIVHSLFEYPLGVLRDLIQRMKAAGAGDIVLVGTPPPKNDDAELRRRLMGEPYFLSAVEAIGASIDDVVLTAPAILKKVWIVSQDMLQKVADTEGVGFVGVPPHLTDDDGYLPKAYWSHDVTHANAEYGRLLLAHVVATHEARGGPYATPAAAARSRPVNPYHGLSDRHFWSRSISRQFDRSDIGTFERPLIRKDDLIISAGSCFAANLVPYLEAKGLTYLRTEPRHPLFVAEPADNFSYDKFSAAYGNLYTTRQLLQLLQRCLDRFHPADDRWHTPEGLIDPFRPGLRYPAQTDREFDRLTAQHLAATARAFTECTVFIFTLGLTEAWVSTRDGAVLPAAPGTISGSYDPAAYEFVNFTVTEVTEDLQAALDLFREMNPEAKVILTVSPVPLVATATDAHVLAATTYSKSVLRVAAETIAAGNPNVNYFPAYEIVTGAGSEKSFFEADLRNVSQDAVDAVMGAFLSACETHVPAGGATNPSPATEPPVDLGDVASRLSAVVSRIECEEAGQDA